MDLVTLYDDVYWILMEIFNDLLNFNEETFGYLLQKLENKFIKMNGRIQLVEVVKKIENSNETYLKIDRPKIDVYDDHRFYAEIENRRKDVFEIFTGAKNYFLYKLDQLREMLKKNPISEDESEDNDKNNKEKVNNLAEKEKSEAVEINQGAEVRRKKEDNKKDYIDNEKEEDDDKLREDVEMRECLDIFKEDIIMNNIEEDKNENNNQKESNDNENNNVIENEMENENINIDLYENNENGNISQIEMKNDDENNERNKNQKNENQNDNEIEMKNENGNNEYVVNNNNINLKKFECDLIINRVFQLIYKGENSIRNNTIIKKRKYVFIYTIKNESDLKDFIETLKELKEKIEESFVRIEIKNLLIEKYWIYIRLKTAVIKFIESDYAKEFQCDYLNRSEKRNYVKKKGPKYDYQL